MVSEMCCWETAVGLFVVCELLLGGVEASGVVENDQGMASIRMVRERGNFQTKEGMEEESPLF